MPSKLFGGEVSEAALTNLSVGGESPMSGMSKIDLSGAGGNADSPSEADPAAGGFRPWSDEETAALLRCAH